MSSPGAPEVESTEAVRSVPLPLEHTSATPDAASLNPKIAENIQNNDLPVEIAHAAPPPVPSPEPVVLESISPPSEQPLPDGAEHPAEQAQAGAPVEASQVDGPSSEAVPHTEEIPMNETGA